jgi:hypothetical protein
MKAINRHQLEVAELPEGERMYSAIGRFIVGFSNLEMVLKLWIADTIDLKHEFRDQIITQDFAMLCTIASSVLPSGMMDGAPGALRPVVAKLQALNTHRVRIAHGWWLGSGDGVSHVSRQKLKADYHYSDPVEVAALADKTLEIELELRDWYRLHKKTT